ncbi:uncharacterized protein BcabD6B2_22090 [Babesia caballi]|uniref:Uncharacterized protein n=1 Tax=Babesia caballi TaxID=5871 RepID=A0AAV4LW74_BABCB|nr:hypothetical protein, conserved [Babesia caballi]
MDMNKYKKLATALNTHPEFENAKKQAFDKIEPSGVIRNLLANKLRDFLGHMSQGGDFDFTGDKGIIKKGNKYTSKYQDATWNGSDDAKDMAHIFLGAAAMTFWGLSFMYHQCTIAQGWGVDKLAGGSTRLGAFITTMGYNPTYLDGGKNGHDIAKLLEDGGTGFDGLVKPETQNIYDNYVRELDTQYDPQNNALNSPLTACYKFAKLYFTSQFTKSQGTGIDGTLEQIKEALKTFKSSCGYSAPDLSEQIDKFLKTAMTEPSSTNPGNNSDHSSPAGPVAGTLTTLGLGGGAAAAYIFNFGGAKTLVKGLLRIG